jgi:hypothetical protein
VKQGAGTAIAGDGTLTLGPATVTVLGGVKQGTNTTIAADGTISATTVVMVGSIRSVAVSTILTTSDYIVIATAAAITITLPAAPATGEVFYIKNGNATAGQTITVAGGGHNIDGAASVSLDALGSLLVTYDGAQFWVI